MRAALSVLCAVPLSIALTVTLASTAAAASSATTISLLSGHGTEYLVGDDAWAPATSICAHPAWAAPLAGSSYVSDLGPSSCTQSLVADTHVTFRQTFKLPAGFTDASLKVSWYADNAAQVYLNGQHIGGNTDSAAIQVQAPMYFQSATTATATTGFHPGLNSLIVVLHNWGTWSSVTVPTPNPYGVDFAGTVTYTPRTPTTTVSIASGAGTQYVNGSTWSSSTAWSPAASCGAGLGAPWAAPLPGSVYVADVATGCTWASPRDERYITFRQTFTLPRGFSQPSLSVSWYADNAAQVYLNGTRIGGNLDNATVQAANTPYFEAPAATASAASGFRAGTNELIFVLHNWPYPTNNPYGLDFAGTVTYTAPTSNSCDDDSGFRNRGDCQSYDATDGRNKPGFDGR